MDMKHAVQKYFESCEPDRDQAGQGKWLLHQQHLPWQLKTGEVMIWGRGMGGWGGIGGITTGARV